MCRVPERAGSSRGTGPGTASEVFRIDEFDQDAPSEVDFEGDFGLIQQDHRRRRLLKDPHDAAVGEAVGAQATAAMLRKPLAA